LASRNVYTYAVSKISRASKAIEWRLRYHWQPKALLWDYLRRRHPAKALITALGDDLRVRVYPRDVIGRYIFIDGVFERECWNFVKGFVRPGMVVFDLGANLGQYTLLSAKAVGPGGKVHSFEPSSSMFEELRFNIDLNDVSALCVANRLAVSDTRGIAWLSKHAPGGEVFDSLAPDHLSSQQKVTGYEKVETTTVDAYVRENDIPRVDFLKIDIEGAELPALRGARKLLSDGDAPTILVELADVTAQAFGYRALDTWDFLSDLGYRMYLPGGKCDLRAMDRPSDFSVAANVVAVKQQKAG
jgi:FkbM family methyltransferase